VLKNILFVSDFSKISLKEFEIVADLALAFQAAVHIVFVNFIDNPVPFDEAHNRMKQLTVYYPQLQFSYNVAETNDEEYAIAQFAHQLNADFIAITISEKSAYAKFASLRSAERVVNHEQKPVLVLKT
jgi:nucleotide-binding universal stress UspA family protein